jgi:hypothetical protein
VFVASLCFSVIVSRQRQQIERLIEETAILTAEVRELRSRAEPAGQVGASAAKHRADALRQ